MVRPSAVLHTGAAALAEEDEAFVALEGHLLARVEELLRRQSAPIVRSAGKATILA